MGGSNKMKENSFVGKRIRERRKELGITQEQLGELVFLSRSAICKIEQGKRAASFQEIKSFSIALKCTPNDFCPPNMSEEMKRYYHAKDNLQAAELITGSVDLESFMGLFEFLESMK